MSMISRLSINNKVNIITGIQKILRSTTSGKLKKGLGNITNSSNRYINNNNNRYNNNDNNNFNTTNNRFKNKNNR